MHSCHNLPPLSVPCLYRHAGLHHAPEERFGGLDFTPQAQEVMHRQLEMPLILGGPEHWVCCFTLHQFWRLPASVDQASQAVRMLMDV